MTVQDSEEYRHHAFFVSFDPSSSSSSFSSSQTVIKSSQLSSSSVIMSANTTNFPPGATLQPSPFKINIPESSIEELKTLLRLSRLPPKTYENQSASELGEFGVGMKWIKSTKEEWEKWDW